MMETLHSILEQLSTFIDLVGIGIVMYGFGISCFGLLTTEITRLRGGYQPSALQQVRIQLGGYILTGIEFMIASDIIHTVLSRELMDLVFVSALVVIRTAISFFLGREVRELNEQEEFEQGSVERP